MNVWKLVIVAGLCAAAGSCAKPQQDELPRASAKSADTPQPDRVGPVQEGIAPERLAPVRLSTEHLPNALRLTDKVISGGLPDGADGFAELQRLGVRTVVSVDGAKPDVDTAAKYGLQYVHLPHGYDGIPESRVAELAKAVVDLPGPIYIHCHHGKHRSPAAAVAACVSAGTLPSDQAHAVLELAGTNPHYVGLYRAAESARPIDADTLRTLQVDFRPVVELPPLAEAMVSLEHVHDEVQKLATAGWRTSSTDPAHQAAHVALMLQEQFTELLRMDAVREKPAEFRAMLERSERASQELQKELAAWQSAGSTPAPERAGQLAAEVARDCKSCHEQYRDQPLR